MSKEGEDDAGALFDVDKDWREEWRGMPEFVLRDMEAWKALLINFRCEDDLKRFGELIGRKLNKKTLSVWWPEEQIDHFADKRWVDES